MKYFRKIIQITGEGGNVQFKEECRKIAYEPVMVIRPRAKTRKFVGLQ